MITMVTVGYGDIHPVNHKEMMYVVGLAIISSGMFGYTINTIGAIFQSNS